MFWFHFGWICIFKRWVSLLWASIPGKSPIRSILIQKVTKNKDKIHSPNFWISIFSLTFIYFFAIFLNFVFVQRKKTIFFSLMPIKYTWMSYINIARCVLTYIGVQCFTKLRWTRDQYRRSKQNVDLLLCCSMRANERVYIATAKWQTLSRFSKLQFLFVVRYCCCCWFCFSIIIYIYIYFCFVVVPKHFRWMIWIHVMWMFHIINRTISERSKYNVIINVSGVVAFVLILFEYSRNRRHKQEYTNQNRTTENENRTENEINWGAEQTEIDNSRRSDNKLIFFHIFSLSVGFYVPCEMLGSTNENPIFVYSCYTVNVPTSNL